MSAFFDAFQNELDSLHAALDKALADLPPEALDWSPAAQANSLGVLAVHVAGSERYWIGEVAGNDPAVRDRESEFKSRGVDSAALRARLAEVLAHSHGVLARLTDADLAVKRMTSHHDKEYTLAYALLHSLAHTAEHKGHMELTRQLWEQQRRP